MLSYDLIFTYLRDPSTNPSGKLNLSNSVPTCLRFQNGLWIESYNLSAPRYLHSSWTSPLGVMLLGGKFFDGYYDIPATSELLSEDGQSVPSFDMHYRT